MNIKMYCGISATLFTLVALAHLVRLINGWPIQVDGATIPMAVSWGACVIPGALALWGFRASRSSD